MVFPIRDTVPSRNTPYVTVTLIVFNAVVFLFQLRLPEAHLERFIYLFGIVPLRYTDPTWAHQVGFPVSVLPFLTSMFLHGGWFHIISNMWVLWIFGDNVEDRMGSARFLIFYLLSGIISGVIHTVFNAESPMPSIGASGAIAGVMGAYFLMYPFSKIICLILLIFYPIFVQIPAFVFILLWFVTQFLSGFVALEAPAHAGGIAWWAHVGGFVAGLLLCRPFLIGRPPGRPLFPDEHGAQTAWGQ